MVSASITDKAVVVRTNKITRNKRTRLLELLDFPLKAGDLKYRKKKTDITQLSHLHTEEDK